MQLLTHRNTIMNHLNNSPHTHAPTFNRDSMSMLTLSEASASFDAHPMPNGNHHESKAAEAGEEEGTNDPDGGRAGFALVVNGHSLVYALSEELELLFLSVAERCNGTSNAIEDL